MLVCLFEPTEKEIETATKTGMAIIDMSKVNEKQVKENKKSSEVKRIAYAPAPQLVEEFLHGSDEYKASLFKAVFQINKDLSVGDNYNLNTYKGKIIFGEGKREEDGKVVMKPTTTITVAKLDDEKDKEKIDELLEQGGFRVRLDGKKADYLESLKLANNPMFRLLMKADPQKFIEYLESSKCEVAETFKLAMVMLAQKYD